MKFPFGINVFLLCLGIAATVADRGNLISHLIGAICVSAFLEMLFLVQWWQRPFGGGDVAYGSLRTDPGWKQIILAFLLGCIIGSVVHVIRIKISGAGRVLAMGPYLSVGFFWRHYREIHG